MTVEQLKSQISTLTLEERAEIASFALESLDTEEAEKEEAEIKEAWRVELDRRMQEFHSGAVKDGPAEELLKELRESRIA